MYKNSRPLQQTPILVARTILAALLLLMLLSASLPLTVIASGPTCTLACCAGRPPHAAGSCMDGSCHAFLGGRKTSKIHLHLPVHESEQLCGLQRITTGSSLVSLRGSSALTFAASSKQSHGSRARDEASVSISTMGKPCQPDCGTGTFSSSSQGRPRDSAATSYADKPRPPSTEGREHSSFSRAQALDASCRRSRPRGPPISAS